MSPYCTFLAILSHRSNDFLELFEQDKIKISIRLTCGSRASCLSVSHALSFSLSLVSIACRSPLSFTPPLLLSRYTSLFLCLFGPQTTTLLSSPPSLFPHFTSDFGGFFSQSIFFFCLVSLLPCRCLSSLASVSLALFSIAPSHLLSPCPPFLLLPLFKYKYLALLIIKTYWEVCTGGGTRAGVGWGMGKVKLCRGWTDQMWTRSVCEVLFLVGVTTAHRPFR